MVKDIDILRESIVEEKYHLYKQELKKCVKNVINDYKKLLKENEELLEVKVSASAHNRILELEKEIKELRKENNRLEEQVEYDKTHIYTPQTIELNFISKSKIRRNDEIIDILNSDLRINEKNFWYDIGVMLTKRIKGVIKILYNKTQNKIEVKIFHERFNYIICMQFPCWELYEKSEVLEQIFNYVKNRTYDEFFYIEEKVKNCCQKEK